jgi:glycosyltransferase involved in cell wall biosynthesis
VNERPPKVAIGLPVRNGARFLSQAVESILNQTFEDFELIISDNASEDATEELCRTYALQDRRVRYVRNERNAGAAANFNKVFHLARSLYFKWASHDDTCAPTFLERCVSALDADPSAVLAYPSTRLINEDGSLLRSAEEPGIFIDSYGKSWRLDVEPRAALGADDPIARFRAVLLHAAICDEVFGLIRASVLSDTSLIGTYYGSDKVLLAELSLLGPYRRIPDPLFHRRCHPQQSSYQALGEREYWISGRRPGRVLLPQWNVLTGYSRALGTIELDFLDRLRALRVVMQYLLRKEKLKRFLARGGRNYVGFCLPSRHENRPPSDAASAWVDLETHDSSHRPSSR